MNKEIEWFYKLFRPLISFIYKLYYNPKIIGKEYLNQYNTQILICGNHMHLMDQFGPIISTKRVIHYMAKKEYFDSKKTRWFFRLAGCISVDRKNKDEIAKQRAINILNNSGAVGIFPEGTRNKTDKMLLDFKYGAVSLAKKTNAIIIPFAVTGTYKFRSKDLVYRFGKPINIKNMDLESANKKLYKAIYDLKVKNIKMKKS